MNDYKLIQTTSIILFLLQNFLVSISLLASYQPQKLPKTTQLTTDQQTTKATKDTDLGRFWIFQLTDQLKMPKVPRCTNVFCVIFLPITIAVFVIVATAVLAGIAFLTIGIIGFVVFIAFLNITIWWKLLIIAAVLLGPQLGIWAHNKLQKLKKRRKMKQKPLIA